MKTNLLGSIKMARIVLLSSTHVLLRVRKWPINLPMHLAFYQWNRKCTHKHTERLLFRLRIVRPCACVSLVFSGMLRRACLQTPALTVIFHIGPKLLNDNLIYFIWMFSGTGHYRLFVCGICVKPIFFCWTVCPSKCKRVQISPHISANVRCNCN